MRVSLTKIAWVVVARALRGDEVVISYRRHLHGWVLHPPWGTAGRAAGWMVGACGPFRRAGETVKHNIRLELLD